jgi:lipopolysaccharide assembly outer membrane protein LptD (OstA)
MYYPTKREDRATGFLLPTDGTSTVRGQSLHNAFFWAIDRSEDLTVEHSWFSKTGQGVGSEYRYNFGGGSDGDVRAHILDEHETTYLQPNGSLSTQPARRSYEIHGGANQMFPNNVRARGRVDYFSSLAAMQTLSTNIFNASQSQRSVGGNLVGAWSGYTFSGTFDRNESFSNETSSTLNGGFPRVTLTRNERPIPGTPLYVSAGTEYVYLLHDVRSGATEDNRTLSRMDFTPQVRFPFKKWQWFTINSTAGWRDTYYSRSINPATNAVADDDVNRRFFTLQAQLLGPVFTRIWDTPENSYAEKFKHSIEPFLTIGRTSSIDNFSRIVPLEGIDSIVGGVTQYAYGLTNRFYAKRRVAPGQPSQAREIVDVEVRQTYYTDQRAAQYDTRYATSFTGTAPNNFSPIALSVRAMPTNDVNAQVGAEFDSRYHALRTISANGSYAWSGRVQTTVGWSKKAFIEKLDGFNRRDQLTQSLNVTSNVHTRDNKFGGIYAFNYDVLASRMLQQRLSAFYNAQCCGIAFEYQTYNFAGVTSAPVPADHRFFLSFTLAGLGNFSPFNGALSGVPR